MISPHSAPSVSPFIFPCQIPSTNVIVRQSRVPTLLAQAAALHRCRCQCQPPSRCKHPQCVRCLLSGMSQMVSEVARSPLSHLTLRLFLLHPASTGISQFSHRFHEVTFRELRLGRRLHLFRAHMPHQSRRIGCLGSSRLSNLSRRRVCRQTSLRVLV